MKIIGLVAVSQDLVIGLNDKMPWHYPEDLKWFKSVTMGKAIAMGRTTAAGLKFLKGRRMYTLTRNPTAENEFVSPTDIKEEELFLCGGAQIYEAFLELCDEFYITQIKKSFVGDTYFPARWSELFERDQTLVDNEDMTIAHYIRRQQTQV